MNSPSVRHQRVARDLLFRLMVWTEASPGRGEACFNVDVMIDGHNVYCPDLFWFSEERAPGSDDVKLPRLPDLAIEVLSPSTRRHDLGTKKPHYEEQGLRELWLIDPRPGAEPVVSVFRRSSPGLPTFDLNLTLRVEGVLTSPQLEGFAVKVRDLLP